MSRNKTALNRLRHRIESIAKNDGPPPFWGIATILHGFSILYGAVMAVRARLYKAGLLPTRALPCRVVSIGNITAGGTGKTPMTIFVAQAIKRLGYRVVVISRGYKGRMERSGGVVSDGQTVFHGPDDAGDEPYLMATTLTDIPVVVGGDRYNAGMLAIRHFAPDVIVLDDAFQHLRLKRDLDIVLLDHQAPLGNGHLIPRGRLREPVSALRRPDAIVFTRCKAKASAHYLTMGEGNKPTFYTNYIPIIKIIHRTNNWGMDKRINFSSLNGRKAVAFSGLADNDQFVDSLKRGGCRIVYRLAFDDHHQYCFEDMDRIVNKALQKNADFLITTAKDWVKIQPFYQGPLAVVVVDVHIDWQEDSARFHHFLSSALLRPVSLH